MSAGLAGRAGAVVLSLLLLLLAGDDDDAPVKLDAPPVVLPAPALSHGLGGLALLAVDMSLYPPSGYV